MTTSFVILYVALHAGVEEEQLVTSIKLHFAKELGEGASQHTAGARKWGVDDALRSSSSILG